MKITVEVSYDGDQLTALQKRDLEKLVIANEAAIGTAVGTALATVINTTLSWSPTMPTVTGKTAKLDPLTSTGRAQTYTNSRDY